MIILEGPNGAGKSVLAEKLSERYGLVTHKFKEIPQNLREFNRQQNKSIELIHRPIIQDRCPIISDYCYARYNTQRRRPLCTANEIVSFLRTFKPLLIFCWAQRLKPTRPTPIREMQWVPKRYVALQQHLIDNDCDFMIHDYSVPSLAKHLEFLIGVRLKKKGWER